METVSFGELAYLAFEAAFCALALWWCLRYSQTWPPESEVTSPRARLWYRRALLVFAVTVSAAMLLRFGQYLGLVSDATTTVLGSALAVPFFLSAVALIVYRVKHGL
jgi:hypothetical protein